MDAGVILPLEGYGFCELPMFQDYFAAEGIAIVILVKCNMGSGEPLFFDI